MTRSLYHADVAAGIRRTQNSPPGRAGPVDDAGRVLPGGSMDPLRPLLRRLTPYVASPRWPKVRAVLVALHVLAVLAVACPAPVKGSDSKSWRRAGVRAELSAWSRRLHLVGIDVGERELAEFGQRVSASWSSARNTAVAPALAWLKAIGATQGWYMFTAPDRAPQRFTFAVTTGSGKNVVEHLVFDIGRSVDDDTLFDPRFLGEHRVRRAFFQSAWSDRPVFREMCSWLAREAAAQRPDVGGAVCRLVEQPVIAPADAGQPPLRPEKTVRTLRVDREGTVQK
jgi:hypothetical protein